ncbi:MAG: DUF6090 family protein [Pseudomonadota bacterium]
MLKYLKFGRSKVLAALGEIALIVIGILLALQIDQWNSDRLDRQKEIEYLSFIRDALQEDVQTLEELSAFNQHKGETLVQMMRLLASGVQGEELNAQLNPLMSILTRYNFFAANRIAFDNLKSTHSLALIGNSKLQRALTEYYASERGLIGTSEHLESWTRALGPLVASQTVHARWFAGFPEFVELPDDFQLPMRSVEEVRLDVTPELGVHLFYVGLLNEAQRREFALELEAAQSLLELVAARYEQLNQ